MIASNVSTAAVSPTWIPMCNRTPEKNDSNSMVALSVSISARISPSSTASPTCLSQEATVPSSMVSLRRGMLMISTPSGMAAAAASAGAVAVVSASAFTSSAGASALSSAETSSPSSPMIANNTSTGAVSPA